MIHVLIVENPFDISKKKIEEYVYLGTSIKNYVDTEGREMVLCQDLAQIKMRTS